MYALPIENPLRKRSGYATRLSVALQAEWRLDENNSRFSWRGAMFVEEFEKSRSLFLKRLETNVFVEDLL